MATEWLIRQLKDDIVYWGTPSPDGFGGATFADYVDLKGRWEDRNDLFIDTEGKESMTKAVVYVTQDMDLGGWLFKGLTTDISSADQDAPQDVDNAYEIRGFKKVSNMKGDGYERKVFL